MINGYDCSVKLTVYIFEQHDIQIESLVLNNIRKRRKLKLKLKLKLVLAIQIKNPYRYSLNFALNF